MFERTRRVAHRSALRLDGTGPAPATRPRPESRALFVLPAVALVLGTSASGCTSEGDPPQVRLETQRLTEPEVAERAEPAIESGHPEITVRLVFTALGPCRDLTADVVEPSARQYVLQVTAHAPSEPCPETSPHIGYTAVITGLPEGRSELRVVHITTDGRRTMQAVFEHPVLVSPRPAS